MSRLRLGLLPTIAVLALLLGACSREEDSSGLATLLDPAPVAETVPESEEVEAAGVVAAPPETTGAAAAPSTEAAAAGSTGTTTVATTDTAPTVTTTAAGGENTADSSPATTTQPGTAESNGETGDEDLSDEERLLRFADCMREHGVDFPDPVVEADGSVQFGFRPGGGGAGLQELGRDSDLRSARQACEGLLAGLSFGPGSGNFDTTELQDTLLEFARCMRANGVDMDDPDLSNFGPGGDRDEGPGGGPFGDPIDLQDPDVVAALEACQEEVNIGRFGGGGRGGNS